MPFAEVTSGAETGFTIGTVSEDAPEPSSTSSNVSWTAFGCFSSSGLFGAFFVLTGDPWLVVARTSSPGLGVTGAASPAPTAEASPAYWRTFSRETPKNALHSSKCPAAVASSPVWLGVFAPVGPFWCLEGVEGLADGAGAGAGGAGGPDGETVGATGGAGAADGAGGAAEGTEGAGAGDATDGADGPEEVGARGPGAREGRGGAAPDASAGSLVEGAVGADGCEGTVRGTGAGALTGSVTAGAGIAFFVCAGTPAGGGIRAAGTPIRSDSTVWSTLSASRNTSD